MLTPSLKPLALRVAVATLASAALVSALKSRFSSFQYKRLTSLLREYRSKLILDKERLESLRADFIGQLEDGLKEDVKVDGRHMLMLPTYITKLPTGHEQGDCYAIDIGGTNFRVMYLHLADSKGHVEQKDVIEVSLPREVFSGDGKRLFDFLAVTLRDFIDRHSGSSAVRSGHLPVVGFCFSFPVRQTGIASGIVLEWTKGFTCSGVVGQDPVALLSAALERAGRPCRIAVLLNDTVGVMTAHQYIDSSTRIGVILGTGTNACYVEKTSRLTKWRLPAGEEPPRTAVNIEWGSFWSQWLPLCAEDEQLDAQTSRPGMFLFEKILSGLYLGDVARRIIRKLNETVPFFLDENAVTETSSRKKGDSELGTSSDELLPEGSFLTKHLSAVVEGMSPAQLEATFREDSDPNASLDFAVVVDALQAAAEGGKGGFLGLGDVASRVSRWVLDLPIFPFSGAEDHSCESANESALAATTESLGATATVLREVLGLPEGSAVPVVACLVVQQVCLLVARRSAQLLAAALLALLRHEGWLSEAPPPSEGEGEATQTLPHSVTVAFDGGVYKHFAEYRSLLHRELAVQLGERAAEILPRIRLEMNLDGSCLGAAVLAAATCLSYVDGPGL